MDMTRLLRLLPTLEMIAEEFSLMGWTCHEYRNAGDQPYRNVHLYTGQKNLHTDVLYALRPGEDRFPTDDYSYVCTTPIGGTANHLYCPGQDPEILLDALLDLFYSCQQREQLIDHLTYRGGSLQELCDLGAELLENPVFIHDDWFIMIGVSRDAEQVIAPEYVMTSTKTFLPRVLLDDFKHDSAYLETYAHPDAQVWTPADGGPRSLYVNLWDSTFYRGRLLVLERNRPFRRSDFLVAQVLTQRAILLLQRKPPDALPPRYRSMDDIMFSLLEGKGTDTADLTHLLSSLSWDKTDPFLCLRVRYRSQTGNTVLEHVLHSDLFRLFRDSYVMFTAREQCLVLNLARTGPSFRLPEQLGELCRDYGLYLGVSSPVSGIHELHLAYYQARVALEQAAQSSGEKSIVSFSDCALEHILNSLNSPLQPWHLIAPELHALMDHDREKGTQYFETLRSFLLQERDIPRTAEALIIHRTTLLYRLKKIGDLFHINLDDPWRRLYLLLSLWIMEQ